MARIGLGASALGRNHGAVVVAVLADDAFIAERFGTADSAAVQDQRIGGASPARLEHRRAELLFYDFGIVALRNSETIRDAEHVAIHRQTGHAERMAEHDIRGLAGNSINVSMLAGTSPPCFSTSAFAIPRSAFDFAR